MTNHWKQYLGNRDFYRKIAVIAIPISLQQLITVGVNLLDTIMLGTLGDAQLSASALAGQFIHLFQICCMGIGMGASVLTSRFWGMKDLHSLKKTITIMLRICLGFVMVFTIATLFYPEQIIKIYSKDPVIIEYGARYLRWSILSFLSMGFSLTCTIVLRSVGVTKIPLYSSICAFFINVIGNYTLIFGRFGAPRMEIAGAALATVIARVFEVSFICGYFFLRDERVAYRLKDLRMKCSDLLREYLRISIPVLISDSLLALGNNMVAVVMGHIGKTFVAANSITTVAQQLSSVLIQGISNASCIMTGHTMGEGDREKAQRQGYTFLLFSFLIGSFAAVIFSILREPLISYYNVSTETKEIARSIMDAVSFIMIFQAMNSILTKGVLRAGGDTRFLMLGDILFLWVAAIPLGALAGLFFHWSSFWVYTMLKIDQIIKCIWCFQRLRSRKWMKKISAPPTAAV